MTPYPNHCIHQTAGLCPTCREDHDEDPSAWTEYGNHAAGLANWRALQAEMNHQREERTMTTYANYSGTAGDYIREYLDQGNTLSQQPPVSDKEARELWASLEDTFTDDGGTGMSEDEFVEGVEEICGVELS